jgi:CubicO group peptidase (beta-lactamase class C family)
MHYKKYIIFLILFFFIFSAFLQKETKSDVSSVVFSDAAVTTCDTSITDEKLRKIDSLYQSLVNEKKFNGSILIGRDEKVLYTRFSGYADFQTKQKLTSKSRFEIASVSKQFTAVAVLMLYEYGKLKLTDTVQRFIPDFPYSGITIHQLLCHRSGLPEYFKFADSYHKDKNCIIGNDSLLRMLKAFKPKILQEPDKQFEYCNTGYAVLASIVERVSEMKFTDFVHKYIFTPLGMTESCFYYYDKIPPKCATIGHRTTMKHYERDYMSGIVGDKGIFTTVSDMFIWSSALDKEKILRRETLEMAFSPQNSELDNCRNYGYGWRISCDTCERPLIYHGGLWNGNNTWFIKRPSDKTTIIVFSNIYNSAFYGRSKEFLWILDAEE